MSRRRQRLWAVVLAVATVFAAAEGLSALLRRGWMHERLEARLAAAFGRPVEVGRFEVSLLRGPRLEARAVTVGEDPRFGFEYFLRAESLSAGLRWGALLRGRLELGTLSLRRASLNLVRTRDGLWNLETWLPPQPQRGAGRRAAPVARLTRVEIDGGRVNFKRGPEKHPFAFVNVRGTVWHEANGRWRLELEAQPRRAGLVLRQVGTLRVRGRVSGTSLRLQPAELFAEWTSASLSDALRLARGHDFGVRGDFEARVHATTDGGEWRFRAEGGIRDVHRWDLPGRPADPAVGFQTEARWRPDLAEVFLDSITLATTRSTLAGAGHLRWSLPAESEIRLQAEAVDWNDLFAWYPAFREDVAEGIRLEGVAALSLELGGWPPRILSGTLTSDGARLSAPGLPAPVEIGETAVRFLPDRVELAPVSLAISDSAALSLEGGARAGSPWRYHLALAGAADRAEHLLAAAAALGWREAPGWEITGGAALRIGWRGAVYPFAVERTGVVEPRGLRLRTAFLNQPVELPRGRIEFGSAVGGRRRTPGGIRAQLSAARAFGAEWSGTVAKPAEGDEWEFALRADRLDLTEMDRWLGPRARRGLLARMLPGLARDRRAAERAAWLEGLRATGTLRAARLVLPAYELETFQARVTLAGGNPWQVEATAAQARMAGGEVRGTVRAELGPDPLYHVEAELDGVDLTALAAPVAVLAGRVAGRARAELTLTARGVGREALLGSLQGTGRAEIRDAVFTGLNLADSFAAGAHRPGTSRFTAATAGFHIGENRIEIVEMNLAAGRWLFEAEGTADFSSVLDLRVRLATPALLAQTAGDVPPGAPAPERDVLVLRGSPDALRVVPGEPRARR